jgi:hypothetical protein
MVTRTHHNFISTFACGFFFNSLKASWAVLTYCWLIYDAGTYVGWELTALQAVWFPSNSMDGSMKTVSFESACCRLLRVVRRSYSGPLGGQVWGHMISGSCISRDGWSGLLGSRSLPVSPHNAKLCCLPCCLSVPRFHTSRNPHVNYRNNFCCEWSIHTHTTLCGEQVCEI